jgi:hypothetical protein
MDPATTTSTMTISIALEIVLAKGKMNCSTA